MLRSDYRYHPMTLAQYDAIVTAGTLQGTSPLHGQINYDAATAEATKGDVDLRVLLAGLLFEDHFGTDPNGGVALAKVYNFGGIIFAQQPGAFRSDILRPLNERPADPEGTLDSSHYAGFYDFGGFVAELIRTLNNEYCGPAFQSGDLARAWGIYVGGPNNPNMAAGQSRVDQFAYYTNHYPAEAPVTDGVYGEDLIAKFETQIGQPYSGSYDPRNGNHPWSLYCRAGVESTGRNCGLSVVAHTSAVEAENAARSQGLLQGGTPEHGGVVQFNASFYYPDGHTGLFNADRAQLLGTLTDGTGVGYRNWGPQTPGYAGWYRLPGVVGPKRIATPPAPIPDPPHPIMEENWVPGTPQNPNPYDQHPGVKGKEIGVGGGFLAHYRQNPNPWQDYGWPETNEMQALVDGKRMTVQFFERAIFSYDPAAPGPWQVVVLLRSANVVPLS